MKKKFYYFFLMLFISISAFAQHGVKGTITDAKTGEPLAGVNVVVKGSTSTGTISDANGVFTLSVPGNSVLVFSYIGYLSQEVSVKGKSNLNVSLSEDVEALDEIVVVGYGTMKKRDLTGSLSSVKAEDMQAIPVPNPIMGLQGRVPGVVITNNTGAPQGDFTIRVRGTNSIRGGNDPLYVVDGMPVNISSINSQDIESVEVLKDASATAIYGSRGANGVILITTKSGKSGTSVTYDGSYGVQSLRKKMEMLDATEWATLANEMLLNDTGKTYFTDSQVAAFGKGFDWQDAVFDSAPIQNHNLSISSANEKTKILISGSILLRDGIIKNSAYDKYNLRGTINHDINNKFHVDLIMSYARTATMQNYNLSGGNRGGTLLGAALYAPPSLTPYNEDGSYKDIMLSYPFMSNALRNPIVLINETSNKTKSNLNDSNVALTYKPIKGLSLKSSIGIETLDYRNDAYVTSKYLWGSNSASVGSDTQTTIVNENIANYDFTVNKNHSFNVMGGFTYQQYLGRSMSMSGTGFISDAPGTDQIGSASSFGTPSTSYTKWVLMSYLGRLNYSFKGKYLATVSMRADGSSRYSVGNKWGYFPSAALAWRISDEPFLKNVKQISNLKLRLGYGETGSTAISPYSTLNMLKQGKQAIGSGLGTYYAASTVLPSDLKWETTAQWNVGIDLSMFDSRLRVTADYYNKTTRDLLNSVSMPASTGYSTTIENIGKMGNKGIELLVEGDIIRSKNLVWTASGNIAFNKNRVKKLYGGKDIYGSTVGLAFIEDFVNLIREGEPLGVFYTYKENGYNEKGIITYVDKNGDGVLSNEDKFITGDPNPDFTYGLQTALSWKGIDLSLFFQGSQGNDIYNVTECQDLDYNYPLNFRKDVLYSHWSANNTAEQNAAAKYPKITRSQNLKHSDRYVEDGSYLRLKDVSLGYNLPVSKWGVNNWIKGVKLYVSAQNMLTITGYSGMDPEINSWGGVNAGLDYLTYPNVKTVTFGVKVQF
jgi:TonB-linked SusC/RagA family outer membrane protein